MSKHTLIVFARVPVSGKVKTRLIPAIGAAGALRLYIHLMDRMVTEVQRLKLNVQVWYASGPVPSKDCWSAITSNRYVQPQVDDLGERMRYAMEHAFAEGATRVVIAGTDIPDLTAMILEQAVMALETHDAVVGPAKDGGYYLLGLTGMIPSLFQGKRWSTETVCAETLNDLDRQDMAYTLLPELRDIDTVEDLNDFPELMQECGFHTNQAVQQEDPESDKEAAHGEADS